MTPYAVLLTKPSDSDEEIRRAYHAFARRTHPDTGADTREAWERYAQAYTAVKTAERREDWARRQALLAGGCGGCGGCGVRGTRMFKGRVRVCEDCGGEGRA